MKENYEPRLYRKYTIEPDVHQRHKKIILPAINKMIEEGGVDDDLGGFVPLDFSDFDEMGYSDYHIRDIRYSGKRHWKQPILETVRPMIAHWAAHWGARESNIEGMWFAQYYQGNQFKWHTHEGCNASAIYYLEAPTEEDITEFFGVPDMPSLEEGDLVVFPAMIPHRSVRKKDSKSRKTVVGMNINIANIYSGLTEN